MNCSQARTMLAAYKELKKGETGTTALDAHLQECAACRQVLAHDDFIGSSLRSLPVLAPPADAQSKLMQALAVEQARFIQRQPVSAPPPPTPAFLVPYLRKQTAVLPKKDPLTAFSTADTGPIPIVRTSLRRRHLSSMSPFAIVGLAATFLLFVMAGGMVSLLVLANRGISPTSQGIVSSSVQHFSQVSQASYTTESPYSHIMSAVANRWSTYYTAYDNTTDTWMLEKLENLTQKSTPMLSDPSSSPLILLGISHNWLLWLQFDAPKTSNAIPRPDMTAVTRTWSLYTLFIGTAKTTVPSTGIPTLLLAGTFDQSTVPSWIKTPIQGIWFNQEDGLLLTMIDKKGTSHLLSYQLDPLKAAQQSELATAKGGHILTFPTANVDDTRLYWSEEWLDNDAILHSDIWTQQVRLENEPVTGRWTPHTVTLRYLLRDDQSSFHPQVVNDTLFLLNTGNATDTSSDGHPVIPTVTAQASPTVTAQTTPNSIPSLRMNPVFYPTQLDAAIQGRLQAFSTENDEKLSLPVDNDEISLAPQAGERFLLWQNSNKGFEMYDAVAKSQVTIGQDIQPRDIAFLAVNDDTVVWMTFDDAPSGQASSIKQSITFRKFDWPRMSVTTG